MQLPASLPLQVTREKENLRKKHEEELQLLVARLAALEVGACDCQLPSRMSCLQTPVLACSSPLHWH